ncbi:MAG: tetratricopeptide repeat protein [Planctomycetota bacterium]
MTSCGGGIAKPTPFMAGNLMLDEGNPHGALESYERAVGEYPDDYRLIYNMGSAAHDLFLRQGDRSAPKARAWHDRALQHYDRVLVLSPGNARALSSRAVLMRDGGDLKAALASLQSGAADGEEGRVLPLWTMGTLHRDAQQPEAAIAAFRQALDENDEHVPSVVALSSLLSELGHNEEAEAVVEAGLELVPFDSTLRMTSARLGLARAKAARNDKSQWVAARRRLLLAEQAAPGNWWTSDALSETHAALGDTQKAVRALWRARDLATERQFANVGLDFGAWQRGAQQRLLGLYPQLANGEPSSITP